MSIQALTKDRAIAAVQGALSERDAIQANLLELDGSFGKRLLAGAALTGQTKTRWDKAARALAVLWDLYSAYSGVVDRAAEATAGRLGPKELVQVTDLLAGPSVQLDRSPDPLAPLAGRDLADSGREQLTLTQTVARMRRFFADLTEVVTAAEQVWNEMAGPLDAAAEQLARMTPLVATLGDEALAGNLSAAESKLARLRDVLNTDPLSLWQGNSDPGRASVDTSAADQLRERVAAVAARVEELARLRDDARDRITGAVAAGVTARAARDDAIAAWRRAAEKFAAGALPSEPADIADLSARLAGLDALLAAGRWPRLSAELDDVEHRLAAATAQFRDTERAVMVLLDRREELRGLLDAYQAKAARLGAAEDSGLTERYNRARGLLWTAPCDLAAAEAAVTGYQQAVLTIGGPR